MMCGRTKIPDGRGCKASLAVLGCIVVWSGTLSAQPKPEVVPPCPNAARLAPRTARICAEVLPLSGRIHARTAQGGTCYCECEGFQDMTLGEIDSLRMKRGQVYARNWEQFGASIKGVEVHGLGSGISGSDTDPPCTDPFVIGSTSIYICGDPLCTADEELETVVKLIAGSGLTYGDLMQIWFEFHSDGAGCGGASAPLCCDLTPSITGVDLGDDDLEDRSWPVINVPSAFLRHPEVDEHLIAFLLLHEIGHGVKFREGEDTQCEPEADVWAAEVGFNMVYGDTYGEAITAVLEQLQAFYEAVYDPDVVELPFSDGPPRCLNEYPKLACRKGLIDGASSAEMTTYLGDEKCWEGEVDLGAGDLRDDRIMRCGEDCGDRKLVGPFVVIHHFCSIHPELCIEEPWYKEPRLWPHPVPHPGFPPESKTGYSHGPPVPGPDPGTWDRATTRRMDRLAKKLHRVIERSEEIVPSAARADHQE